MPGRSHALAALCLLGACPRNAAHEEEWSQVRGDPAPPPWAAYPFGLAQDGYYGYLFSVAAPEIPNDLTQLHVICKVVGRPDGNPLDGPRDLTMTWTLGGVARQRYCGVDEDPCIVGFNVGEIRAGAPFDLYAVDRDDPDPDDVIGTMSGSFTPGPKLVIDGLLRVECRTATPDVVRKSLAPLLRHRIPKLIPDPEGSPEDPFYRAKNHLTRVATIVGWDHPDVWPLVKRIDDLTRPGSRPQQPPTP